MTRFLAFASAAALTIALTGMAQAQSYPPTSVNAPATGPDQQIGSRTFNATELVSTGHNFFGSATRGLAGAVEHATKQWGEPNGYILGEEGGGAIIGGLRYGEGKLYTRDYGDRKVFWQGPSVGFDFGGDGARTMMLVYNLPQPAAIDQRFAGVDGSVYVIGGFGLTALAADKVVVVPIRSGVGARLGVNVGYLKFTPQPTWNPF